MKIKAITAALGLAGFVAAIPSLLAMPVSAEAMPVHNAQKTTLLAQVVPFQPNAGNVRLAVKNQNTKNSVITVDDKPSSKLVQPVTPAPVTATVNEGDTLVAIADVHQTTYVRLFDANADIKNPDVINPGQVIRIPAADEQMASRPLPATVAAASLASQPTAASAVSQPRPTASSAPAIAGGSVWDQTARCESGGNWAINTGNGFFGGLQFTLSSWQGVGGSGYPHQASREEQIARAQILQQRQGWGAWPACTAKLGIR